MWFGRSPPVYTCNCPARPTGLTVDDLMNNPREVAYLLFLHTAFNFPPSLPRRRLRDGGRAAVADRRSQLGLLSLSLLCLFLTLLFSLLSLSLLFPRESSIGQTTTTTFVRFILFSLFFSRMDRHFEIISRCVVASL